MKPKLLLLLFIMFHIAANGTTYYISASGNDSNNGTSILTPWKTLSKLNAYFNLLNPGDNVLFNRGDVFYGSITINKSGTIGSPITIGAYGTGANPLITGFTSVPAWTSIGNNIWESTNAVSTLSTCNMVVVNGVNTAMGRWPNKGYLTYEGFSGNTSITSSSLNNLATNWTGAEAVIKKDRYIIDRNLITSQSGSTINYSGGGFYNGQAGFGFFIQNDSRVLDTANEWYYNPSTKKIRIYSISSPVKVQVSSIDTLVYTAFKNYITIANISFSGANKIGINIYASHDVSIQGCNIDFCYNGITGERIGTAGASDNFKFQNSIINHSNNNGLSTPDEFTNAIITNNIIKNSGVLVGMSGSADGKAQAMNISGAGSIIQYNEVDSSGYIGIGFDANSVTVSNNFVNYFCLVKDDGGGIYTDNSHLNVIISYNTVLNGIGTGEGTTSPTSFRAEGIYCDDHSSGMSVFNNIIANTNHAGIFLHNANNIAVSNNTTFNCGEGLLVSNDDINSYTTNLNVKNNVFVGKTIGIAFSPQDQRTIDFRSVHTSGNSIATFGNVDSNYYARPYDDNLTIRGTVGNIDNNYSLSNWQSYTGFDSHSLKSPKLITDTNDLRFEYNATSSIRTINLDANYMDVKRNSYNGSVTLPPYSSVVLIKNGPIFNLSPTANAGSDLNITLPVDSVKMTGTGTATNGTITSYQWRKISGPLNCLIADSTSASTLATNLSQGVYNFELKVTDNNGGTGFDTMMVTVRAANIPPIANAGQDQAITLPANSLTLSGSAVDSDGTIISYFWTKISGPSVTIINPALVTTPITGLVQGIYSFQLKVTDNNGATSTDTLQVIVNPAPNKPPVANAGADQLIALPVNTVTLTGIGSDEDGTVVSYLWSKISGPASYKIVNDTAAITNVTGLIQGVYEFQLKITDNAGATGTDVILITINAAPQISPVANAGADQIITLPNNTITLSGSGNDPDGTIAGYAWTEISGPSNYNIINPASQITDVTGLVPGVYQFQLEVTDNNGIKGSDLIQIIVNPQGNIPPVANAGADQIITLPQDTTSILGKGTDSEGIVLNYNWIKISGPPGYNIDNPSSPFVRISSLTPGVYQFELQVTDNNGATGTDIMQITVNAAVNIPPIANAGLDQTITSPSSTVTLSGSGIDSDGTVAGYRWMKISGPSNFNIVNPLSPFTDVSSLKPGIYQFQLQVTDNQGAVGTDIIQITVNAASNIPPVANAGTDQTISLPVDTVTLSGIGNDMDGTVVSYSWTKISGPSNFIILNDTSAITNVSGMEAGIYQFELQVTDNNGATGLDTIMVTVNAFPNLAPKADAGPDQIINLPLNSIMLSGSASDSDGTIVIYRWTKISGPSNFLLINPSSAITNVTGLFQGAYQFQLEVTDDKGATGRDTIQVTVNLPGNIIPVANAGADQTISLPINTITLSGSGTDSDGAVVSYTWTKISGPSSFTFINSSSAITNVTGLAQGVYQFQLEVTDNNGGTGTDIMKVTVNAATNQPPVANAGSDKTITLPTNNVTLSGNGSDPDGTIVSYFWTKISGPSTFIIVNAASASTDITNLVKGNYKFQLKVTDNNGATATDIIKVIVNAAPNQPPVANAGADKTITLPTNSVTLSGSGSDADGTVAGYLWTKISGPSGSIFVNGTTTATTISGLVQGNYQFQLQVTDNKGAIATDIVQVIVNAAPNQPPVANAGPDKTITLPTNSVTLSGSGSDADGTIAGYLWTKISGPSGSNIINPNSPATNITGLLQGSYQFQLQVTDNKGAIATDIVQVIVNAAPNQPPVANAGPDKTITLPTNSVTLSGSGTDADGTVVGYNWTKISGPSVYTILNGTTAAAIISNLIQGNYQFQLQVTDDKGAIATDIVQVTVNAAPNQPPVANAGPDKTITLPTNSVTLSGSGTDADGTIAGYLWTKISGPSGYNILNPTSAATDVTGLERGIYLFELKLIDNNGARGRDTIKVIVNAAINISPVAHAGPDQKITLPINTASFSGSASDADGTIVSYLWTKISGPSSYNIVNSTSPITDVWGLVQGIYQFELKATDNSGATAKDTMEIMVNSANIAPIANAGTDQTITLPMNSITLLGNGKDPDGMIAAFSWKELSGPTNGLIVSPDSAGTLVNNLNGGTYKFELTVTDNLGAQGKDTITIVVAEPRLNLNVQNNSIKIFPNPVIDITTLVINNVQVNQNSKVEYSIRDIQGRMVYKNEIIPGQTSTKTNLNLTMLAKGVYSLCVFFSKKEKQIIQLIKL